VAGFAVRVPLIALLLAALLGTLVALTPAGPAAAEPGALADARSQALALRTEVERLERAAAVAVEDYNAAQEALAAVVTEHVAAQQARDAVQRTHGADRDRSTQRVRALYMSGGGAALYASVLGASDVHDVMLRTRTVARLVGGDLGLIERSGKQVEQARAAAAELDRLSAERVTRQQAVAAAADEVTALLEASAARLAEADAEVVALAEQERARVEAEAAAAAAAHLAALQAASRSGAGGAGRTSAGTGIPAPSDAAAQAVAVARSVLGRPYRWGATGPGSFDCSGLLQWSYRYAGVSIPRVSRDQWRAGPPVPLAELAPGDLLFWAEDTSDPRSIYHVGMYVGGGQMINSPRTGDVVKISPVRLNGLIGAVRPAPPAVTARSAA
jgi:cell wall-associated NlpC family hydrolase